MGMLGRGMRKEEKREWVVAARSLSGQQPRRSSIVTQLELDQVNFWMLD